ncbi:MAG: DUF3410 domain-containing protein, partial [Halieaceae bacterium]
RVITLHPSLTLASPWPSRHLLGVEELAQISAKQLLINASRGEVIDNAALLNQLQRHAEWPVVLDVWEGEPALDPRLLECVVIGSAHIAGYSLDSKFKATDMLLAAMASNLGLPKMSSSLSSQQPEPVSLAWPLTDAQILRSLLGLRYQIMDDDKLLRDVAANAAGDSEVLAASFDRLRKTYAQRRELAGSAVVGATGNASRLALALGCHTDAEA